MLHSSTTRQAETDAFIVDRFKAALGVLKATSTEQQRQEYLTALALIAPPRTKERDNSGMARPIAERLEVRRGKRSKKQGGRPFAFDKAMDRRAEFDAAAVRLLGPLGHIVREGERVLTHNGPAELARFTSMGGCVVIYRAGDCFAEKTYASCYGNQEGSARLQRVPPSLQSQSFQPKSIGTYLKA